MAKKQTRRSISVSRTTYERLKAFCEANNISMSQLVETRVNDFLGEGGVTVVPSQTPNRPTMPAPVRPAADRAGQVPTKSSTEFSAAPTRPSSPAIPMTSAAARFAVDPPPPIIKPKQETAAPKPAEKTANQIFTFQSPQPPASFSAMDAAVCSRGLAAFVVSGAENRTGPVSRARLLVTVPEPDHEANGSPRGCWARGLPAVDGSNRRSRWGG